MEPEIPISSNTQISNLIRFCVEYAKLYKKRNYTDVLSVTNAFNRAVRRAVAPEKRPRLEFGCTRCGLLFHGVHRCQCPALKGVREQEAA